MKAELFSRFAAMCFFTCATSINVPSISKINPSYAVKSIFITIPLFKKVTDTITNIQYRGYNTVQNGSLCYKYHSVSIQDWETPVNAIRAQGSRRPKARQ